MTNTSEFGLSDVIRTTLRQVLIQELGSNEVDVNIETASKKGDNYMGVVYRVNGKLSHNDENGNGEVSKSSINVILKVAPTNKARRESFTSREIFLREIMMYNEVLPMFHRFQLSRGVDPEMSGFYEYPKCYKTIDTEIEETVILEDLKEAHFEMFDRFEQVTIDHVRLIMKALGKYHALSFALRDQQPETLKRYSTMEENFMRKADDNVKIYLKTILDGTLNVLDHDGDEPLKKKLKEYFEPGHLALMRQCCDEKLAEPYAVICHGDCWNNNVMFKYDKSGKPVDLRLLDWQIARYASPVTDLMYYIFCCTTKSLRDQYYDDMIKTYHVSLSEMLTRLGSDPAKLFPFAALQDQLRKFGVFGLVTSSLLLPMLLLESDKCPDLDEVAESLEKGETIDNSAFAPDAGVFNQKMRDVIVDMDRLGYL